MMAMLGAQAHAGLLASAVNPFKAARQRAQARDDAEALLERFRIPAQYHPRRPKEISYGMQRMLSIALAYGRGASVLLLDERSEEHTSELQSLMRISYAVFCL